MLAKILTINSGAEVPNATIVSPITSAETPRRLAREEAPSTSKPAPLMSAAKPTKNRIEVKTMLRGRCKLYPRILLNQGNLEHRGRLEHQRSSPHTRPALIAAKNNKAAA